jgi:SAM-dependent methyltransferase
MSKPDPTRRFTDRVDAYVAARPGYPGAIATRLAAELGLARGATVADIGCGTGLSCVPFLRAGFGVIGVEPNAAMRAAGARFLAQFGAFRAVEGKAEATTLADHSVDLVIAAQAAHWFDLAAARIEALRILRAPPWAALIWNDRASTGSPFAEGYEQLLREFGTDYEKLRHRQDAETTVAPYFGGPYRAFTEPNVTSLDFPTLLARAVSASYMPQPDAPSYAPMQARLRRLFDACASAGKVEMAYTTRVFFGAIAG